MSALTVRDAERLADLEVTIAQGLTTFVEVGAALAEIRDSRLYRETHGTFEDYCRERWQMDRRRAYETINAAGVVGNLSAIADTPPPANEAQARPLTKLEPEQQRAAWKEAVETAPEGKVTAAHVAATVQRLTAPEPIQVESTEREPAPESEPHEAPAASRGFRPKPNTKQLLGFIRAAIDAANAARDSDDEQVAAIATNDFMIAGLREARELCDRLIRRHEAHAKQASA